MAIYGSDQHTSDESVIATTPKKPIRLMKTRPTPSAWLYDQSAEVDGESEITTSVTLNREVANEEPHFNVRELFTKKWIK